MPSSCSKYWGDAPDGRRRYCTLAYPHEGECIFAIERSLLETLRTNDEWYKDYARW